MKLTQSRKYFSVVFVLVVVYAAWAPKGMSRLFPSSAQCVSEVSPKGSYRVDICRPSFPYISFSKEMPRFVRFYDHKSQRVLGESDILDMAGRGEIFWPQTNRLTILVGGGNDSPEIRVDRLDGQ